MVGVDPEFDLSHVLKVLVWEVALPELADVVEDLAKVIVFAT